MAFADFLVTPPIMLQLTDPTDYFVQTDLLRDRRQALGIYARLRVQPSDMPKILQYGCLFQAQITSEQCARINAKRISESVNPAFSRGAHHVDGAGPHVTSFVAVET